MECMLMHINDFKEAGNSNVSNVLSIKTRNLSNENLLMYIRGEWCSADASPQIQNKISYQSYALHNTCLEALNFNPDLCHRSLQKLFNDTHLVNAHSGKQLWELRFKERNKRSISIGLIVAYNLDQFINTNHSDPICTKRDGYVLPSGIIYLGILSLDMTDAYTEIGNELIKHLYECFPEGSALVLQTRLLNHESIRFYLSLGFLPISMPFSINTEYAQTEHDWLTFMRPHTTHDPLPAGFPGVVMTSNDLLEDMEMSREDFRDFMGEKIDTLLARIDHFSEYPPMQKEIATQALREEDLSSIALKEDRSYSKPYTHAMHNYRLSLLRKADAWKFERELVWAAGNGDLYRVYTLLHQEEINPNATNESGATALTQAIFGGSSNDSIIELLLTKKASVNLATKKGLTPLMLAAFRGYDTIVARLLQEDIDINATDSFGNTALERAIRGGHRSCIDLLLKAGAKEKISKEGVHTKICYASRTKLYQDRLKTVTRLVM